MLVLTRKIDEEIVIAGKIRVVIVDVSGEKVRLGIKAPPSIRIMRKELLDSEANEGPGMQKHS
jgi:carbon storage regulator